MVRPWRLHAAFALRRPIVQRRDRYAGQIANLLRSQHVELVAVVVHDGQSLLSRVPLFRLVSAPEMTRKHERASPLGAMSSIWGLWSDVESSGGEFLCPNSFRHLLHSQ
jgi:hypothetical protein